MAPHPHAVIFDLDGTLVDSLDDITAALDHALTASGQPGCDRDRVRAWIGDGARALVERAIGEGGGVHADVDAIYTTFRARYAAHLIVTTAPYPGVAAVVAALEAAGRPLAVLSNKPDDMTRRVVAATFPGIRFGAVAGQRAGVPIKPDPAAALEIIAGLGLGPADCAFVGDSDVDVATAARAGMRSIGVGWGFRGRADVAGADVIVETPDELARTLGVHATMAR